MRPDIEEEYKRYEAEQNRQLREHGVAVEKLRIVAPGDMELDLRTVDEMRPDEYEPAPPPADPGNRRIWEEAGRPPCGAGAPKEWLGIVLEAVQQLKVECPGIRFWQIKEKIGRLCIYCDVTNPKHAQRASAIVRDAESACREIDEGKRS